MYSGLKPGPIMLTICNQVIQSVECVKLLGIHIDDKLSFNNHISTLCKRASKQCNAFNRIAKFLSKESKECLFNAFNLSNFMCCWKKSVIEIEKINRKALRIVVNDYTLSYTDLLSTMERCPMYVSRLKSMATEIYDPQFSHIYWKPFHCVRYFLWLT